MHSQRVSLRDVARAANVSHVTVSLALRDHPKISEKTRQNIHGLAAKLGYKPDPMLRALAEYRKTKKIARYQATLAWINNFPTAEYPERYRSFRHYQEGALERVKQLGYGLDTFSPLADGIPLDKLRRILMARGIHGLLVGPHLQSNTVWDFDVTGFSAVAFGFTLHTPRLHVITNSQARSSSLAVEKLRALGHSRIGLNIFGEHNDRTAHNFLGGFLGETMPLLPKNQRPFHIFEDGFNPKAWKSWYDAFRPDAVIVSDAEIASAIERTGVKVPKDLSVAVLVPDSQSNHWAGIDQNDREIGRVAVDTLVGMLHRNETGSADLPYRILVESTWKDGPSVRRKRNREAADSSRAVTSVTRKRVVRQR